MKAKPRSESRALQKEQTREHLFGEAMRLFEERGYEAVNIDDIVKATEVARGTFYFHFPKKDDLLLEAILRGEELIVKKLESVKRPHTLAKVLQATAQGFAEAWGHRRALLPHAGAVALRKIAGVEQARESDPLRANLSKHIERALEEGELRSVLPAQMLADIFLLNVFAALMAWASKGEPELEVVLPAIMDLFLRGAEGFGEGPKQ